MYVELVLFYAHVDQKSFTSRPDLEGGKEAIIKNGLRFDTAVANIRFFSGKERYKNDAIWRRL